MSAFLPKTRSRADAFAVIREAMRGKSMVALGRIVLAKRERAIMLQPWVKGLMGTTLRYPYELRDSKDYFDDIPEVKVPGEMLKLAEHILETKTADFNPAEFHDRYEEAVVAMLKSKQAGLQTPKERSEPVRENVVNLMDALRRSIADGKRSPASSRKQRSMTESEGEIMSPKGSAAKKPAAKSRQKRTG